MNKITTGLKALSIILITGLLIVQSISCKKFLEVQPRDYMFEEEAFSTKKGVESVLNGLYQSLSDSMLYGKTLTMGPTEQMAQYYYSISGEYQNIFKDYSFMGGTNPVLNQVWSKSYRIILGINNFCSRLENPSYKVPGEKEKALMLGEAYGIRAFLHFDLLRMFGPVYSMKPADMAIPYINKPTSDAQPLLPANAVIDHILSDLEASMKLLDKDPVRNTGPNPTGTAPVGEENDYWSGRHRRMNYFAVKALQARVLLYAGRKQEAYQTVESLISEQEVFFPWQTEQQIASDPMLSKETFFGTDNRKIYDYYRQFFSPLLNDDRILTPAQPRLDGMYAPNSTDLRLKYWFKTGLEGNKNFKVFIKHSNASITDPAVKYYHPLIRKSEIYLIAAETVPNLQQGYFYLNSLRVSRGLTPVNYQPGNTFNDLLAEIRNEYQRELIGEGQTFFMFKRLNLATIPAFNGTGTVTMDNAKYVVPLPVDETYYR